MCYYVVVLYHYIDYYINHTASGHGIPFSLRIFRIIIVKVGRRF